LLLNEGEGENAPYLGSYKPSSSSWPVERVFWIAEDPVDDKRVFGCSTPWVWFVSGCTAISGVDEREGLRMGRSTGGWCTVCAPCSGGC